jgi:flagellar biogenesis protein FliO
MQEPISYFKAFAVLVGVLLVMVGMIYLLQALQKVMSKRTKGKKDELKVQQALAIDAKRKIVIVKRNSTRYVLLLGQSEQVIEITNDSQSN